MGHHRTTAPARCAVAPPGPARRHAGLVSVILGTASGAQNVGIIGAFGLGGYIALAGLWGSPISGAQGDLFTEVYKPGKS
jgi:hypothetical protein